MAQELKSPDERNTPEYLAQLLKDKKQIQAFPNVFLHLERILDEGEILFIHTTLLYLSEHMFLKCKISQKCRLKHDILCQNLNAMNAKIGIIGQH